ncbi:chemotaxis protein CheW [Gorillibacterium sp. sgz5001074]|uniref:chemotaxis protein CheW n=1 Tax=Gorillibacterium sp. sgz5001074 TaxID=3446695 RepID=UPI003F6626CD
MYNHSAYLSVFLDELEEQLQILDEQLLQLESGKNPDTIAAIFRAAHTLKGSSAAMGFTKLEQLTHRLENVFDQIRNRKLLLYADVINTVFDTVDDLKRLRTAITDGTLEEMDIRDRVGRLDALCQEGSAGRTAATEEQPEPAEAPSGDFPAAGEPARLALKAMEEGQTAYILTFKLSEESALRSVRAHLICTRLQGMGQILETDPSIGVLMDLDPFPEMWSVFYCTRSSQEEIGRELNSVSQIERCTIRVWEPAQELASENPQHSEELKESARNGDVPEAPATAPTELPEGTAAAAPASPKDEKLKLNQTIRVDVDRLEHLLNLVGELIIDHTRLQEVKNRLTQQVAGLLEDKTHLNGLHDTANHLTRVIGELQESMMKTRMLPVDQLFNRFPRMVRDLSQKAGKEILFQMEGKETELDRTLIEELSDPLIHILRNSADHGIETPEERLAAGKSRTGHLTLKAEHRENLIVITVTDDGRGIDPAKLKRSCIAKGVITEEEAGRLTDKEAINLIFRSGVSTASRVTDLSGRGVGMDIVSSRIEKLNGIIDVESTVGIGTVMTIKLPMTLAIMRSLLVQAGHGTFAIPLVNVIEIVRLREQEVQTVNGERVCLIRGEILPLVSMKEKLKIPEQPEDRATDKFVVVVVGLAEKKLCLRVDRTIANQEIVIKNLGSFVGHVPHIAGSTILGGGNVALVLDISSLIRDDGQSGAAGRRFMQETQTDQETKTERQAVIFQAGQERYCMDIGQVKEIITVPVLTPIQGAPPAVIGLSNLRGSLLPVIHLQRYLGEGASEFGPNARIIILDQGERDLGILVDKVSEVVGYREDQVEEVPPGMHDASSLVSRVLKRSERMIPVLDVSKLHAGSVA